MSKPVIVGHAGVEPADGSSGATAHRREGSSRRRSDEGGASRLRMVRKDGSAVAIGLKAALTRDVEGDD